MFVMSDRMYNGAKKLVQVYLPALSALYFGLASVWGLPAPDKVVGSIAVLCTFIGVCIGISNSTYKAMDGGKVGTIVITEEEDGPKKFSLEVDGDPEDMESKSTVTFRIEKLKVAKAAKPVRAARKRA